MKVFLSWSGEKSKAAAEAFRRWLPCVLQSVRPWMSDRDIGAGARWGLEVGRALEQTKFGILFVTDTNFSAPWLLFEAGALAKTLNEAFVCPYLVGLEPEAIPAGPLTQFQAKRAVKGGTLDLVNTLNRALGDQALPDETLQTIFEKFWSDLETALRALPGGASPPTQPREVGEMVAEILGVVRGLANVEQRGSEDSDFLALKWSIQKNDGLDATDLEIRLSMTHLDVNDKYILRQINDYYSGP